LLLFEVEVVELNSAPAFTEITMIKSIVRLYNSSVISIEAILKNELNKESHYGE